MHRITKIEVVGTDVKTNSYVKMIHNTANKNPFYSRTCAYNQTFKRLEKTILTYGGEPLVSTMPLMIKTLKYLRKKYPKSILLTIKELTESRLSEEKTVFLNEVERIKKDLMTSTKVIIFYFQIVEKDWEVYDFEDIKTLVYLLLEAKSPHITIPIHPKKTFVENSEFLNSTLKLLSNHQTATIQFDPNMKKKEGEQILRKVFLDDRCLITLFKGLSPNAAHLFYYSLCWNYHPKGKLLMAADVRDTFGNKHQKLPTHMALRRFGFDITCRKVTFPTGQKFDFPVPPSRNYIYDDNTGGMLAESSQERWYGKSVTEFILQNFPANTGLDFREYVLAFNFVNLNNTGLKEADSILRKEHEKYILARPFLTAYWNSN